MTKWIRIAQIESDSEPGKQHEIKRHPDGYLGCSCHAYRFCRGTRLAKTCKHIQAYASKSIGGGGRVTADHRYMTIDVKRIGDETFTVRRAITFGEIPIGR